MAEGLGYETPLKRRREGRTDYGRRLELLKSGEPRAVVSVSNKHARVQIINYSRDGDSTDVSAFSSELEDFGWDLHTGNLPAAYLTGFLAGLRSRGEGISRAIADLGSRDREYGSRHYAAVKGLIDSGIDVPSEEATFPAEERLQGQHLGEDGAPETLEEVKKTIREEYGDV